MGDYTALKDYDDWKPGIKVTFEMSILPKEGYRFDTAKVKNVSISNGEIVSMSINSGRIRLKVNYVPKMTLEDPSNIYFKDDYVAAWDKVDHCKAYEVQILKENDDC